ncbi:hypothetical protein QVD17_16292 [Tagetes erecta]|uniref:Uncharacterized protein n=1 Tax=Tagetes erecta TaxID=13708 RepID=A0AAD8KRF1_TARER|nr:hypothetical protein QVD17_16292 [Tagetes erecta]
MDKIHTILHTDNSLLAVSYFIITLSLPTRAPNRAPKVTTNNTQWGTVCSGFSKLERVTGSKESGPVLDTAWGEHDGSTSQGWLHAANNDNNMPPILKTHAELVEAYQQRDLEQNDDLLIFGKSQVNIGPVENEVDPSNHDIGLDNSDPFNLGPLTDEVMA